MSLASPVQKDGFSFVGGTFYREASNSNSHRRATLPELKAHFSGKDNENRPAHWYEAQLLHYGLPPSKVKGTAHKRLFDALMAKGNLTVPAHIQKIEADLKKEWAKKEREAKKALKTVNVSVQVSSTGTVKVAAAQPAAKKTKTGGASSSATTAKKTTTVASKKTTTAAAKEKKTAVTKAQTVKSNGKPASSSKPAKTAAKARAPSKPTAKQTAASSSSGTMGPRRRGIGLLNGRYRVSCPYIEDNFPECLNDLRLIATLDGDDLWLNFDFSPAVAGLMKVSRPYEADQDQEGITMFWRGHALDWASNRRFFNVDTIYRAGPVNRLYFLGGGHISGKMSYDGRDIDFDAHRLPDQSMTSEISPAQARAKWARLEQNMDTSW
ncbi:hypothetical protein VSDG_08051 [Cytospora chrysosperma]|uniref:Uncharacterized protein n=1 Tax=Cytospora chrysosperma TaxID=252740 RepID=A0A423VFL4_CYTCH|nr:hypothetical protein VSDG_08051 [Valsa sordida]